MGIFMAEGTQGNIIRRNIAVGNPPISVALDRPSSTGFDILNLAVAGMNIFVANTCLTALGAPCPSLGPTLTASPNPIPVTGNATLGATTISWSAPDAQLIEIHIGRPDGPLLTRFGNRGSAQTGSWVFDGTVFYMQDVTGGRPLTSDYTLATLIVRLQRPSSASLPPEVILWALSASALPLAFVVWVGIRRDRRR